MNDKKREYSIRPAQPKLTVYPASETLIGRYIYNQLKQHVVCIPDKFNTSRLESFFTGGKTSFKAKLPLVPNLKRASVAQNI